MLICFTITFDFAQINLAVSATCLFFHPWNSFLFVTSDIASVLKSLREIGLVLDVLIYLV